MKARGPLLWSVTLLLICTPCLQAGVYEDALAAKKEGRTDDAERLLKKTTSTYPGNAEAWFHYGTVLGWQAKHAEALAALRKGLAIAPEDFDLRITEATTLAWNADYAGAESRLAELDKDHPNNVEVTVMRGKVATWRGDPVAARQYYEAALAIDPNRVDALTGLGDLEMERNHTREARSLYVRAQQQDNSKDLQQRIQRIDDIPTGRFDFGVSGSTFGRGEREDWWGSTVAVSRKVGSWNVWARYEYGERFGLRDQLYEFGAGGPLSSGMQLTVFGGFTPDAKFSANSYAEATLRSRIAEKVGALGSGWLLTEARWADYAEAQVNTYRLGWEQELRDGWRVEARWVRLDYDNGEATDGWLAMISWEPKEGWTFRLGAGQSVESLTNQTLNTSSSLESWTAFAGISAPLWDGWFIRIDLEREDVVDSVVRYGLAVGVGCYF